ncbi:hypothetical protein VPH35_056598 [Triticum aestivum]
MGPDWSSLPSELLGHIADCLLATNDVDCYMDFRAVCTSWRSAAEDPMSNPSDVRFHPRRWILVDEVFQTDERLMVNMVTARVVRKDLPLLRKYDVITTTPCGLLVLADLEPPHAARVLNPLTGHMFRFAAPVPFEMGISAATFSGGSSPELVLSLAAASARPACGDGCQRIGFIYVPRSPMCWNSLPLMVRSCSLTKTALALPIFLERGILTTASCMDTAGDDELEPVKSIGDQAIFVGYHRSLSIAARKIPSIAANCIYYVKSTDSSLDIYKYNLETEEEERVSEAIDSLNPNTLSFASPPFTIVQLLSSYTINARESQLAVEWLIKRENYDGGLGALHEAILAGYSDRGIAVNE